jgi:hypothetical protein
MAALAPSPSPSGNYESDEDYHWDGDDLGDEYVAHPKVNKHAVLYSPSCSHVSVVSSSSTSALSSCLGPQPPRLLLVLQHLLTSLSFLLVALPLGYGQLAVADTGATDHMVPDKSCFISYTSISGLSVRMGNNSYVFVLGQGRVIFALNSKRILVRNALHVPGLAVLLYSLRTHITQQGCGCIGMKDSGFLVYFPTFILLVDTAVNCHLSFDPLCKSAPLDTLHYVQPRCPPAVYPSKSSPALSTVDPSPAHPAFIEDGNNDDALLDAPLTQPEVPPLPASSLPLPGLDMSTLSMHLKILAATVDKLSSNRSLSARHQPFSGVNVTPSPVSVDNPGPDCDDTPVPQLFSTMSQEEITHLIHHPGTSFPLVRPCNTANASNTKTHWTSEELHCIMGCRKFRNYKHLLQVSRDGEWVDGGKFPSSLGSYAPIPKAKRSGALDRTKYRYLDAVHMDIAFGNCVSVGGFHYTLVLVDRATRYTWNFGLKSLSSADIISALCLFRAAAGSLARCFYCDCDLKLFGSAVSEYLIDGQSKVVAAPAKRQSANGLVESH